MMDKPQIILDTSPLITLCTFRVEGQLVIEHLLAVASILVVETVAQEATVNPTHSDAAMVSSLVEMERITKVKTPKTPLDAVIDGYTKLGQGERDSIRLALTLPRLPLVLDDYLAFVIASRFELKPVLLLDLVVSFIENEVARQVAEAIAPRYSIPFVSHTFHKLAGER